MQRRRPETGTLECGGLPPLSGRATAADLPSHPKAGASSRAPEMPDWPHAPMHCLTEAGAYIVTAGTCRKLHHFRQAERLSFLQEQLLRLARAHDWQLQAWAVFSNHYHFVAMAPADPGSLRTFAR